KLNVYCFFVDGVLIDKGAEALKIQFSTFFKQFDIDQVAITHFHEDHTVVAAYLQKERNITIYMSDIKREDCMKKEDDELHRKLFWCKRKTFEAKPFGDSFQSKNAEWKVIETPGHAIDHVAFLNTETSQLFSGDLYCQEKTKVILREESIPTIIHSL